MSSRSLPLLIALTLSGLVSCFAPGRAASVATVPDVPVSLAPYGVVHTDWKQRVEQPYVFLEILGDYSETGLHLNSLMHHVEAQGLRPTGPPFGLFFDDPGRIATKSLRSRLAIPVEGLAAAAPPLGFDLLPAANVLYSRVAGPYRNVSAAYPGMFDEMRGNGWVLLSPIREVYLVDPGQVQSFDQLITEVQMPWRPL